MSRFAPWLLSFLALRPGPTAALPATVIGRKVLVEGKLPLHIKGVNWNPVPVGGVHPDHLQYSVHVHDDGRLMAEAGVNVLRTYEALTDRGVLDALWARGIQVINTIWSFAGEPVDAVRARVEAVKDHPAILMWSLGNEWNYNGCYTGLSRTECQQLIGQAARMIKDVDRAHPVASVYGNAPPRDVVQNLPEIDVWGINYYEELTFSDLFTRWAGISEKPMFLGEYGADAYNALAGAVDTMAQAHATSVLTQEIVSNSVVHGGVCSGGIIFELSDEWWKDGAGSPHVHDVGGVAPGGGPHPDRTFNEEWWGLTTIDRAPREAYHAFANVAIPKPRECAGSVLPGAGRACSQADGCRVVLEDMQGRSCASYCQASGLLCAGAFKDASSSCSIQAPIKCDDASSGTPSLVCQCAAAPALESATDALAREVEGLRFACTRGGCSWI